MINLTINSKQNLSKRPVIFFLAFLLFSPSVGITGKNADALNSTHLSTSKRAYLDPIAAASAFLGIADWFFGFFHGESGPSVADFAANLSNQIKITNDKLDVIIKQNEDVIDLLNKSPSQTVTLANINALKATFGRYEQIMTTLHRSYRGNINKYMADKGNPKKISDLIQEIKTHKERLKEDNNPSHVPFIAASIHIEYYLRNKFEHEEWRTLTGEIGDDKDWLKYNMFEAPNSLQKTLQQRKLERESIISQSSKFILRGLVDPNPISPGDPNYRSTIPNNPYRGLLQSYVSNLKLVRDTAFHEPNEYAVLRRIGLLSEAERPVLFVRNGEDKWLGGYIPKNARGEDDYSGETIDYPGQLNLTPDQEKQAFADFRTRKIVELNASLAANYNFIIANAAFFYTGLRALEICNTVLKVAQPAEVAKPIK